jgi:hypothetical protein
MSHKEMIRFLTFSQFHNKNPVAGSTHIRVNQLLKYWPEAGLYKYGESPEVLVFQKVYCSLDYQFPKHFPGKKILDVCDPDWLDGITPIKETIDAVDAVTCPTKNMQAFLQQMTDKPVVHIKDRFDLEVLPPPKKHTGEAKTVVWFGYSHNAETLKPAVPIIEEKGLNLLIISEDDPIAYRWASPGFRTKYAYRKYNEATIYQDLQRADFCILPKGTRPVDYYKSENKTVKAQLAGLPVASDMGKFDLYMDGAERQRYVDDNWEKVKHEYDVRKSVKEYKELIKRL